MDQTAHVPDDIRKRIAEELHFDHFSQEEAATLMTQLEWLLYWRVVVRILEVLPEGVRGHMLQLVNNNQHLEAKEFAEKMIPDLADIAAAEIRGGVREYKLRTAVEVAKRLVSEQTSV